MRGTPQLPRRDAACSSPYGSSERLSYRMAPIKGGASLIQRAYRHNRAAPSSSSRVREGGWMATWAEVLLQPPVACALGQELIDPRQTGTDFIYITTWGSFSDAI